VYLVYEVYYIGTGDFGFECFGEDSFVWRPELVVDCWEMIEDYVGYFGDMTIVEVF
jgi:hypothetical protein